MSTGVKLHASTRRSALDLVHQFSRPITPGQDVAHPISIDPAEPFQRSMSKDQDPEWGCVDGHHGEAPCLFDQDRVR